MLGCLDAVLRYIVQQFVRTCYSSYYNRSARLLHRAECVALLWCHHKLGTAQSSQRSGGSGGRQLQVSDHPGALAAEGSAVTADRLHWHPSSDWAHPVLAAHWASAGHWSVPWSKASVCTNRTLSSKKPIFSCLEAFKPSSQWHSKPVLFGHHVTQ